MFSLIDYKKNVEVTKGTKRDNNKSKKKQRKQEIIRKNNREPIQRGTQSC